MIKAVLIDDEPNCIDLLKSHLEDYTEVISIVGTANSAMRGLTKIKETKPDLVFLDVSMPGGTGFEMLDQFTQKDFEVVFTSAHKELAINAFDYSAVNYLLKPIDKTKLKQVIDQLLNKTKNRIETTKSVSDKISINTNKGHQIVSVNHIVRCEGDGGYTYLHLEGGMKILSSQNIKVFEDQLTDYPFARIHKKHLINLKMVKYYTKGKGGHVTLSDGSEISISYRQKAKFLEKIQGQIVS